MPTLAAWLHNLDPFAIRIWPDGPAMLQGIRWYGLSYLLGFVIAFCFARRVAHNRQSPLQPHHAWDLIVAVGLGVLIGGRLGYVFFYQPSLLWEPPVLGILQTWRGGMSSHGGMIGALLGCLYFAWRRGLPPLHITDIIAAAAPLGLCFGRIANFINGELWGRPTDAPWGVIFCNDRIRDSSYLGQCPAGELPRHPSQLYEAGLEGLLLFAILSLAAWRFGALKRPGLVTGLFLLGYGLSRVLMETVREPDDFMPEALSGYLTMGVLLSVPMILIGAWLIWRARRDGTAASQG